MLVTLFYFLYRIGNNLNEILRNRQGLTEVEFLEKYDPSMFERPSVTVDMLIFTVVNEEEENYRKLPEKALKLLAVKRGDHPFNSLLAQVMAEPSREKEALPLHPCSIKLVSFIITNSFTKITSRLQYPRRLQGNHLEPCQRQEQVFRKNSKSSHHFDLIRSINRSNQKL